MKTYLKKYLILRRHEFSIMVKKAKKSKSCYAFLAPYAILFFVFYLLPVCSSIFFSFTYYNILEKPRFIGLQNYINLILQDDIFLTSIKNTFLIAVITGPLGYILSFLFAWLINELPRWLRTIAVIVFYAPSIAGNVYVIFECVPDEFRNYRFTDFVADKSGLYASGMYDCHSVDEPWNRIPFLRGRITGCGSFTV